MRILYQPKPATVSKFYYSPQISRDSDPQNTHSPQLVGRYWYPAAVVNMVFRHTNPRMHSTRTRKNAVAVAMSAPVKLQNCVISSSLGCDMLVILPMMLLLCRESVIL